MRRRIFLALPVMVTGVSCAKRDDMWALIESVQEHLFPTSKAYPSAKSFQAMRYLKLVAYHDSFDREDLDFILRGAEALQKRGFKTVLKSEDKEKILQAFAQTPFGENWISLLITYTLEALFTDPLYGGNKDEIGWRAYHHNAGVPRPKVRFGEKDG